MPQQSVSSSQFHDHPAAPAEVLRGPSIPDFSSRAFPQLFEDQSARLPHKVALHFEDQSLTFAELNARANQLARHLRSLGVKRETIIGICLDRSLDMAVGILGILKSGAAYLPLDPEYPRERLAMMLDDAKPALVLTKSALKELLPQTFHGQYNSPLPPGEGLGARDYDSPSLHPNPAPAAEGRTRVLLLDRDWPNIAKRSKDNLDEMPQSDDLAYVIYTSGSTAQPKGVMITHGNLANYLRALDHELNITTDDVYLHIASIAFSSSRRQLMLPLSRGASVVIASSEERKDPLALFATIKGRGVTVMDAVPSFWRNCATVLASRPKKERQQLLDNKLRLMLSASEPLLSDIPRTWTTEFGHHARQVHMFGQTETAGIVCLYNLPAEIANEVEMVPIGRPIANTEIYILDEQRRPCAVNVAGELYIGGAGVGRGYLNQPRMTAEKFIPNPFSDEPTARLYRTGDWARLDADGLIRFAGRRDQQVKLRGFRVELGEVEAALANHPGIRESVVIAREQNSGAREKKLVGYFVPQGTAPTVTELRSFLSSQLPEHEIPSAFVRLDSMPVSANGKLDRLALPDPDKIRPGLSTDYAAPRNETERALSQIWTDVLGIESIGINDNFFELGGNSLQAMQVCARVRGKFNCDIAVRLMFERPTIASFADAIPSADILTSETVISARRPEQRSVAPLSFTQQQFWLLDQAHPNTAYYNVRTAIRIDGVLDVAGLRQAFEALVARHEILRSNFVDQDGSPVQVIRQTMSLPFVVSDLSEKTETAGEVETGRLLQADSRPFNLAEGPLWRISLIRLSECAHVLGVTIHHIICDGWSLNLMLREVFSLYQNGLPAASPALQFADFAVWQRKYFESPAVQNQLEYWKRILTPVAAPLELATDFRRRGMQTFNGAQESVLLGQSLSDAIKSFSCASGATPFITLLAAFQTLLFRYTGQANIAIGSPVAGRPLAETEDLIGACVNTVVFRSDVSGDQTFRDLLQQVRELALEAYANQEVPFEKLVEELCPKRETNRTPLFQVMFVVQNTPQLEIEANDLKFTILPQIKTTAKFDLTLEITEEAAGLRATLEYNTELFAPPTMQRLLEHFHNLLVSITADATQRISELNLIGKTERRKLLVDWNNTGAEFSRDACIHELFEAQVASTPDDVAAEFNGQRLTYAELNRRANRLANYLIERGVRPEIPVGVCVERSLEMLVCVFAVLKAGGAYVPLDPTYPRERLVFMLEDAKIPTIFTQQKFLTLLPQTPAQLICVDVDTAEIASQSDITPRVKVSPHNVCYVIYTSGSTGQPKGVMVEHQSLVNFVEAVGAEYEMARGDRILQFASLNFDLSAEEIYPALTRGATVVLRTDEMINTPREFLATSNDRGITILDLPTAYWHELTHALAEENLQMPPSVRLVIIGGEKALPESIAAWSQRVGESVRLINTYGPTETTVAVTLCDLRHEDADALANNVSIGRPIRNVQLYVLDESRQPVPIGVPGELYIGGACLARGYLNRPKLTTEKFIPDPLDQDANSRLYRTGDVVRYREDGNIEFLGRADNQIKIRGFRIELEEIERVLRNHSAVADAVVNLDEDASGEKRLIAYVVPNGDTEPPTIELRNLVKSKLPLYMLPAAFERIDAIPLMPSGKVDHRALPKLNTNSRDNDDFVSPTTHIEQLLANAWCEALKVERVGVHDNFFELGGHSLLAARVVSNIRKDLSVDLGMVDVLRSPTIAELAKLIEERSVSRNGDVDLAALLQEVAALSDEEAEARLAELTGEKSDTGLLVA